MGGLLTKLGQRTKAHGVKLVYHNHMGNLGERPEEVAEVLAATDPAVVGFLLDMAHYAQAGGDVAAAVRTHRARLGLIHAKDVRTVPRAADAPANARSYQFVELGRGRVDLPGAFTALARRGLSWMGDPRARRRPRPGRIGECVHAHQQALHRAGAQARPLKARFPMAHSSSAFRRRPRRRPRPGRRRRGVRRRPGRRQAAGRRLAAAARDADAPVGPGAHRRPRRRQAVHVVHLAGDAEEADAVPDPQRRRRRADARLPAGRRASAATIRTTSACGSTTATSTATTSGTTPTPSTTRRGSRRWAGSSTPASPRWTAAAATPSSASRRAGSRRRTARRWSTRTPRSPSAPPPTGCA